MNKRRTDYVLELYDRPEMAKVQYSPRDLFDRRGQLLLAKGRPVTPLVRELLERREVYVLYSQLQDDECQLFPRTVYYNTLTRLQSLYQAVEIVSDQQLSELILLVEEMLAVVEKNLKIYVDLNLLRNHDNYTYVHCINVAILAALIGKELGHGPLALRQLALGALLHDLGKIKIPRDILNKTDILTDAEFGLIKLHPVYGYEMLKEVIVPWEVSVCLLQHHERWHGTGYPQGLYQDAIHLNAQITAVADVFDAVAADRPYRCGLPPYHAVELIVSGQITDFSPAVVRAFSSAITIYPKNATVVLNTGEVGVVVSVHPQCPTRPKVKLLFDKNGQAVQGLQVVDLLKQLTSFIVSVEYKHET
ncbi:MAG: HD-GYP domain-containing protein [Negativicutes bacterium]|nr:HD-GYP domain-containing protein [Negativicutes bacterium]